MTRDNSKPESERQSVSDELARVLATIASENAAPSVSSAPFYTAQQRTVALQQNRRRRQLKFARIAACLVFGFVVLHLAITRILLRTPADHQLEARAQAVATGVLPFYSTASVPLHVDGATVELQDRVDGTHLRFLVRVTLRLRQPLFAPANSNGTAAYRTAQHSLESARLLEKKLAGQPVTLPLPPEMPPLLQLVHRAGEPVVVTVPLDAERFGWSWRFRPVRWENRRGELAFTGSSRDRFAASPHLIFNAPGVPALVREKTKAARNYIIAVMQAVRKIAEVEAAVEPTVATALVNPDAIALPAFADPDAPAVPVTVDPDAPALPAPVDPDAPAITPGLPAKPVDAGSATPPKG